MEHNPGSPQSSITLRLLREADLPFAHGLSRGTGWNQTLTDWQHLLRHEPTGCWLATWEGQPAGTVTTTTHSGVLGWIGMMLVRPDFQRRGIATQLMRQAIKYLQSLPVRWVGLDATPAGQAVYEKLGFVAEGDLYRWEANVAIETGTTPLVAGSPELSARQLELDREICGYDRSDWLRKLATGSTVVGDENGFAMSRPGARSRYLGPVVASTPDVARELVRELLARHPGPTFWDIPAANSHAAGWAEELGFTRTRHLIRMRLAQDPLPGDLSMQYGITAPETG